MTQGKEILSGLDVIIVDDDPSVCEVVSRMIREFYTWGEVRSFTNPEEAVRHCLSQKYGVGIFILDIMMGNETGFDLLDAISEKYPMAYEDAIIITGNASDEVVQMCVSLDITHLIEKPIRLHTLQMAVRSIIAKYTKFAKRMMMDPKLAKTLNML
jgi:DNA-binding NarL/FixJ family response regulator